MERELASTLFCSKCGLQLPGESSFCYQCGTHIKKAEGPIAPQFEAAAVPPQAGLAGAGETPRFTPHTADEPVCRFCNGELDLNGEFCERCGAPVSDAAPSRWRKPAAVAPPAVSPQSLPLEPSVARPDEAPQAMVTSSPSPSTPSSAPSVASRAEVEAPRTQPLSDVPPSRADQSAASSGKPDKPAPTCVAPPPPPASVASTPERAPKILASENPQAAAGQSPKTATPKAAAPQENPGPAPGPTSIASVPLGVPVRGESAFPAKPNPPRPVTLPSTASLTKSPAAKAAPPAATLSSASSLSGIAHPEGKALRTSRPTNPSPPRADQLRSSIANPGKAAPAFPVQAPMPARTISAQAFTPKAPVIEIPNGPVVQFPKTVVVPMPRSAALREIPAPLPGVMPLGMPTPGLAVPVPAQKPVPYLLFAGVGTLLLAINVVAGWRLLHRSAPSARVENVAAQQAYSPVPTAEIAGPTAAPEATPPAVSTPSEEKVPAPARKTRRVKAAPVVAQAAAPPPATDSKTADIVRLQNLALDACAKGNYVEPRDASAITYSQQALALDPANGYSQTVLENSIKGGKYQVQQAIVSKDFTAAHRMLDELAQLLPDQNALGDLKADLAHAEKAKAEEASRGAKPTPTAVLSFLVYHMHSGKATGDKGSYCRGTLSVVAGRLKYVGESATDGQVHSFDLACSDVVQVKKKFRVAFWEKGFHVRTASSNINFVPQNDSAPDIRDLASACSK